MNGWMDGLLQPICCIHIQNNLSLSPESVDAAAMRSKRRLCRRLKPPCNRLSFSATVCGALFLSSPRGVSVDTCKLLTAPGAVPKRMIFLVPALKRWSDVTLLDRFLRMANVMVKEIMTASEIFGRQSSPCRPANSSDA